MYVYVHACYMFMYMHVACYNYVHREFQIGVDIQRGKGRYRFTKVVTMVAHYQLVNRTQYKLAYLQRHQLAEEVREEEVREKCLLYCTTTCIACPIAAYCLSYRTTSCCFIFGTSSC